MSAEAVLSGGDRKLRDTGYRRLTTDIARVFEGSFSQLHVHVKDDRLYRGVYAVLMFPISHPDRFVSLRYTDEHDKDQEIGVITYSPLDQGLLTDRYLDGIPADSRVARDGRFLTEADVARTHDAIVALNTIAAARGQSLADMALAWLLRKNEVTSVLVGASRPQQLLDSLGALNGTDFTDDELAAIDRIASDGR